MDKSERLPSADADTGDYASATLKRLTPEFGGKGTVSFRPMSTAETIAPKSLRPRYQDN